MLTEVDVKVLITGAHGQLATEFRMYLTKDPRYEVFAPSRTELDISDLTRVAEVITSYRPDIVLNCAAYNHVDKAEVDTDRVFKVNAEGVKNLALFCKRGATLLVHYSTDYVFDGMKEDLYTEEDVPNPINNYGRSKLCGEGLLMEETDNFLIFRVSWVFGIGGQNFLYKLSEMAKTRRVLKIVADQVSVPTYTEDIVRVTMVAVENGMRGLYHLTNNGYASRYEVARYYIERVGLLNMVLPVSSALFKPSARRPYFSAMSHARLSKALGCEIPEWRDAIDRFIRREG